LKTIELSPVCLFVFVLAQIQVHQNDISILAPAVAVPVGVVLVALIVMTFILVRKRQVLPPLPKPPVVQQVISNPTVNIEPEAPSE